MVFLTALLLRGGRLADVRNLSSCSSRLVALTFLFVSFVHQQLHYRKFL
jgi:hypothetical protein